MAAVTVHSDFRAQENEICAFTFPPSICHEVMGSDAMISVFWMLGFKPAFSPSSKEPHDSMKRLLDYTPIKFWLFNFTVLIRQHK